MKHTKIATTAVIALLLFSAAPGIVAAVEHVSGGPSLTGTATNNEFVPGTEDTISLYIQNNGDLDRGGPTAYEQRVQIARSVSLDVDDNGTPIEVHTDHYPAGTVRMGSNGPYPIEVTVPEGTEPGTYHLKVTAHYDHTSDVYYQQGRENLRYENDDNVETFNIPVVVTDRAAFEVVDTRTDVNVAQRGEYSVTMKNTGSEVAKNAVVKVASQSTDVSFGASGQTATTTVSRWEPNETKTLTYSAAVADTTGVHNYSVPVSVEFDDADGVTRQSNRLVSTLRPQPKQTFSIRNVDASLRIGRKDGTLTGTVVNDGSERVSNATLALSAKGTDATFDQQQYALGELDAGESVHFAFNGGSIPKTANVSSLPLTFTVNYDNDYGDRYPSDGHTVAVPVAPHENQFDITAVGTVPSGTRGDTPKGSDWTPLTLQVTNNGEETVHNIRPSIVFETQYFQRPIESNYRTSHIETLAPGETKTVTYAVSASATSGGTTYPLDMVVTYEEPNGVTRQTMDYTVPIRIAESDSLPLLPIGGGAVILAGLLIGGFIWLRRD
ncbi:COG1361 S-layer family protein [Halocalculus aciditolerans]|uniref:Sialidase n=1 Tax=Halocalculus aciditolerans TaxID=1383812 RepID=A0A830FMU9_9EURY|nr:hypothetical protein [Halocalculus aciditolerans]GGL68409.1 hypothetical protein GCM10009039_28060 [Halocalculus aciditolerans]